MINMFDVKPKRQ